MTDFQVNSRSNANERLEASSGTLEWTQLLALFQKCDKFGLAFRGIETRVSAIEIGQDSQLVMRSTELGSLVVSTEI